MNNIIEALKQNEKAFSRTEQEMQLAAEEIGIDNFIYWAGDSWEPPNADFFGTSLVYRLRKDYTEPEAGVEIVECVILPRMIDEDFYIQVYVFDGTSHPMHQIPDGYIPVGFKFKGTKQVINKEFGYSHNGVDILPFVEYDNIKSGKDKVLHATHVLFRKA